MRTRSGKVSHRKRLKVRAGTKGMQHSRRSSYRLGKQAIIKSEQYAYRDRRKRKSDFKRLWITRINAAARVNGTTYAKLMKSLKDAGVALDRKMLAQLAYDDPDAFSAVVKAATKK